MFVEAGGDLDELQKLGGWKSSEMVMRYAHFRADHLRVSESRLDKILRGVASGEQQVNLDSRHTCDTPEPADAGLPEVN